MSGTLLLLALALAGPSPQLQQLTAGEIGAALRGKLVSYEPPGSADMGVHEEYHPDGRWAGIRYGRGPMPFSGRWQVRNGQLCVRAGQGLTGEPWKRGWVCRKVWRDARSRRLHMKHMTLDTGPLELTVRPLLRPSNPAPPPRKH